MSSDKQTAAINSLVAFIALIGLGFVLEWRWFLLVLWLDCHTTSMVLRLCAGKDAE